MTVFCHTAPPFQILYALKDTQLRTLRTTVHFHLFFTWKNRFFRNDFSFGNFSTHTYRESTRTRAWILILFKNSFDNSVLQGMERDDAYPSSRISIFYLFVE